MIDGRGINKPNKLDFGVYATMPGELSEMYMDFFWDKSERVCEWIIKRLVDLEKKPEYKTLWLNWIDTFFADCMYPIELKEKYWKENLVQIIRLLDKMEVRCEILNQDKKYDCSHRWPDKHFAQGLDLITQNLMMYRVYAYLFADNKKKLYEMIKSCTMASINNIKWLLKQKNASQLYRKYYDGYIYLGGADYWQEPLSFMFKESLFCELYMDIVPYYEKYVLFLKNYGSGWEDPEWMHEIYKTERDRLITLCDWALEGCDSTIEDLEYSLKIEYAEKAKYERIMLEHYGTDALPKKDTNSMEFY